MKLAHHRGTRRQWNANSLVLLALLSVAQGAVADSLVTLNTGVLNGLGSFYLDFQLLDGNGAGDGNSHITISQLALTHASLAAALPATGTVSGDPTQASGLTLIDSGSSGVAEYILPFNVTAANSRLAFTLHLAAAIPLDSPFPDVFNFLILQNDKTTPLPTQGPTGIELVTSSDFTTPGSLTSFGTSAQSPVTLSAAVIQSQITVPLLPAFWFFGSTLTAIVGVHRRNLSTLAPSNSPSKRRGDNVL